MATNFDTALSGRIERSVALIDDQIEQLLREGAQEGALAAARVGHAVRGLFAARKAVAALLEQGPEHSDTHSDTPPPQEDEQADAIEPSRDDADARALDDRILRGLARLAARNDAAGGVLGDRAEGQVCPGGLAGSGAGPEPP